MTSTPYITNITPGSNLTPNGSLGLNVNDGITFYGGGSQLASAMIANQYYQIQAVGGVNFGSYGTLQTIINGIPLAVTTANTVGAIYLASGPATLVAGPTGASASFANNAAGIGVMTITVAPTGGTSVVIGTVVTGSSLPATGLQIVSLLSGTMGAVSSTYLLSAATGTVAAEAVTMYQAALVNPLPLNQNNVIAQNPAFAPLAAYSGGTAGFDTAAHAQAFYNQVVALNALCLALGLTDV
jgi:hypothetical protein